MEVKLCPCYKFYSIFEHDVVCNAKLHRFLCLFLNMIMFNCLLNNEKAETNKIE